MTRAGDFSRSRRPEGALLAGACAGLARRLGWNVWALRAIAVIGLFIDAITTGLVYAALAVLLRCIPGSSDTPDKEAGLRAPELDERKRRIADLERRFRDLENG